MLQWSLWLMNQVCKYVEILCCFYSCVLEVPERPRKGCLRRGQFSEDHLGSILIRILQKQICFLSVVSSGEEQYMLHKFIKLQALAGILMLLDYPGDSMYRKSPVQGWNSGFHIPGWGDFSILKTWGLQNSFAWTLLGMEVWAEGACGQSGFCSRNLSFEAQKSPFCCLASNIRDRWYQLLLQRVCCCFGLEWFWVQQVTPCLHSDFFCCYHH